LAVPFEDEDEILDSGCDETDYLVLHQFFQSYSDKIGQELLTRSDFGAGDGSMFATGKAAWEAVCSTLTDMKPAFELPSLSHEDTILHIHYQQFMRRNRDRNTDIFSGIFNLDPAVDVRVLYTRYIILLMFSLGSCFCLETRYN
jgi:hypothetical protein